MVAVHRIYRWRRSWLDREDLDPRGDTVPTVAGLYILPAEQVAALDIPHELTHEERRLVSPEVLDPETGEVLEEAVYEQVTVVDSTWPEHDPRPDPRRFPRVGRPVVRYFRLRGSGQWTDVVAGNPALSATEAEAELEASLGEPVEAVDVFMEGSRELEMSQHVDPRSGTLHDTPRPEALPDPHGLMLAAIEEPPRGFGRRRVNVLLRDYAMFPRALDGENWDLIYVLIQDMQDDGAITQDELNTWAGLLAEFSIPATPP